MTQWFRGKIEGYYVGKPERLGAVGSEGSGQGYRLSVYRAAIHDVELLDFEPAVKQPQLVMTGVASDDQQVPGEGTPLREVELKAESEELAELILPPWLPAPGASFFQPTIRDARLFPVRQSTGWFEGPVHQVFIEAFESTHSKRHAQQLYGRFVGNVQAYFELPDAPRPIAAEAVLKAFQDVAEDELPPQLPTPKGPLPEVWRTDNQGPTPSAAAAPGASSVAQENTAAVSAADVNTPAAQGAIPAVQAPAVGGKIPFVILVVLMALVLLLTCGASRAVMWLIFLLPTLLVRRILRGVLPDSVAVQAFSLLLSLGQLALVAMVFVDWSATGCRDVHVAPLVGMLGGLFLASLLPSDIPLLINASTLGALLVGWCTGKSDACGDSAQDLRLERDPFGLVVDVRDREISQRVEADEA